jgi:GNAT superfamily N-acetyltransferase
LTRKQRRQGIATQLMNVAIDYLKDKVATVKLDATAQGSLFTRGLVSQVESVVERWIGAANARNATTPKVLDTMR